MNQIKTAIIPVVGHGTRCLPASKSIPKEMMTLVDRPILDYVVQEAVQAGIEHIIFVNQSTKTCIDDYFDRNIVLEEHLRKQGKLDILHKIHHHYPETVRFSMVRQPSPSGLGDALLCAMHLLTPKDLFAVLLPDVIISSDYVIKNAAQNETKKMIALAQNTGMPHVMVEKVSPAEVSKYGMIGFEGELCLGKTVHIQSMVEKPDFNDTPSLFAMVGRYVLPYKILPILKSTPAGKAGEVQLTDGLDQLSRILPIYAYALEGKVFDCGHIAGYLEAILYYASNHYEYGADFQETLEKQFKLNRSQRKA
ncbi:MAG: UTP--glucose-1-phosphate uridylyltransferase [Alcaligenaceae bacterium]|nr:UTP--glucose-1-phosphate uridylyltransferase [Alcaligenaceae bacterium]